jgi:hypothetical protein
MKHLTRLLGLVALLVAFVPPAPAADTKPDAPDATARDEKSMPEAKTWVTRHKARIGGEPSSRIRQPPARC